VEGEGAGEGGVGGGVQVEALRALLWLQTPSFLPGVGRCRLTISNHVESAWN